MTYSAEDLWRAILALRAYFRENGVQAVDLDLTDKKIMPAVADVVSISDIDSIVTINLNTAQVHFTPDHIISGVDQRLYSYYLKCLLMPAQADRLQRAVTVVHCAQTLDAKMATLNDHSQWIGNKQNLVHAHRMRALTDSIMVGANTFEVDKPQLTVRYVEGENPTRLVLTRTAHSTPAMPEDVVYVGNPSGCIRSVLQQLYLQNIKSVFLEGGAETIGTFLEQQLVDYMQLHIAPMLLGSGKNISLPEVKKVTESIRFDESAYIPVGDEMMFVGVPNYSALSYADM